MYFFVLDSICRDTLWSSLYGFRTGITMINTLGMYNVDSFSLNI